MEWLRKTFELHPEGSFRAQFVEWQEDQNEKFGGVQCRLTFDTEALMSDGRPYRISTWSKPSLHPRSRVSKFLKAIGVDPDTISDDELKTFTMDDYIGRKLKLVIIHETSEEGTERHKIASFSPLKAAKVPEANGDKAVGKAEKATTAINWDEEDYPIPPHRRPSAKPLAAGRLILISSQRENPPHRTLPE